jgi:hypothetical protein
MVLTADKDPEIRRRQASRRMCDHGPTIDIDQRLGHAIAGIEKSLPRTCHWNQINAS